MTSVNNSKDILQDVTMSEEVHETPEDDDEDMEELEDDEEEGEEDEGEDSVTRGRRSGRGLTLMTLLKEKILQPGLGNLTINYLGNIFRGDLLSDGRIRSQETGKIFGTPSAWAIYCKQIVNPNKKSGCGWASVKYRGKKLDEYKNNWNRQKRIEFEREGEEIESAVGDEEAVSCSESEGGDQHDHEILEFDMLSSRNEAYSGNPMIELTTFATLGRLQPFTVAVSSSAMAVIDLHVHLSRGEAIGYLAGQWDVNNHNLIVSHAFPLCCDTVTSSECVYTGAYGAQQANNAAVNNTVSETGQAAEAAIYRLMNCLKLALVGWYHSHPHSAPLPTLKDIDCQLEYEMKMKGSNDVSYTPCIGFIASPFNAMTGEHLGRSCGLKNSAWKHSVPAVATACDSTLTSSTDTPTALHISCQKKAGTSVENSIASGGDTNGSEIHSSTTTTATDVNKSVPPVTQSEGCIQTAKSRTRTSSSKGSHHGGKIILPNGGLTSMNCFWAMPPGEHKPNEYPRPMAIIYNVVQDAFVPKEALLQMRECVKFYSKCEDGIALHETFFEGLTYWDRLQMAIRARVPRDHFRPLIEYLHKILSFKFPLSELKIPDSPPPNCDEKPFHFHSDLHSKTPVKTRESGLNLDSSSGSASRAVGQSPLSASPRIYPDPSKIHPLLVDRSEERSLQPLILDRSLKNGLGHSSNVEAVTGDKVNIQQILTERTESAGESSSGLEHPSSPGVPLPASTANKDYPFPLLRGMVAEQTSALQRQMEQRQETREAPPYCEKKSNPVEDQPTMSGKDSLKQLNENFPHLQQTSTSRSANPPPYPTGSTLGATEGIEPPRGSPPSYQAVTSKRDHTTFPVPLPSKPLETKKSTEESNQSSDVEHHRSGRPAISFSPLNMLSSTSAESSAQHQVSESSHDATTGSSILPQGLPNLPAALSITSVNRSSPINFSPSTSLSPPSSRIITPPVPLAATHPSGLTSPFFQPSASNLSSSPLPSSHTPNLSPSPISFNVARNPSPSSSVDVSPRHTEWAQNALSGMTRPPLISVKSEAALSAQSATSNSVAAASHLNAVALAELSRAASGGPVLGPTALSDALVASAADPWMQASLAGLAQYAGFPVGAFSKHFSDQQQAAYLHQFRAGVPLPPPPPVTTTSSEHPLSHRLPDSLRK